MKFGTHTLRFTDCFDSLIPEDVVFLPFRKKIVALLSTRVHVSVRVSADKGLNVPSNEPKSSDGKLSEFCLVMLKSISDHQV